MAEQTTGMTTRPTTELKAAEKTPYERFTQMVVKEFNGSSGVALTAFQKRLMQNYFISLDQALKKAEANRLKKAEKYRDKLEVTWSNVNMLSLKEDVVSAARIGLDPACKNHVNMMPFKNNTTNQYDIVFVDGYRGKELMTMKYGLDIPDDIIVELVYSTDTFTPIKKDKNNQVESYIYTINDSFNRGEIIGGFYYHNFFDKPQKNRLVIVTLEDILKRKPEYASPEFWGGEKDEWKNGEKTGQKVYVEGWKKEMYWKTVARMAYGSITIDSQKIDDDYIKLSLNEERAMLEMDRMGLPTETPEPSMGQVIDITPEVIEPGQQAQIEAPNVADPAPTEPPTPKETGVPRKPPSNKQGPLF